MAEPGSGSDVSGELDFNERVRFMRNYGRLIKIKAAKKASPLPRRKEAGRRQRAKHCNCSDEDLPIAVVKNTEHCNCVCNRSYYIIDL